MKRYSRRGRTNMNKNTLNLPKDLIIQILLRLPVKSLVRFKCVCKLWLSLISDSHFVKSHFQIAAALTHRLMLPTTSVPETRSIDLDDASLNDDDSAFTTIKLKFLLPSYYFHLSILGSCRGFMFLDCNPNLFLWNPSTGVHKQIPSPPIASNMDLFLFTYLYGFGYDPSRDDYLVVLASYGPNSADWLTHLEFFSCRANAWKEIEGIHLPYMNAGDNPRVGSLLNDAIHWVACRHDIEVDVIVAFDLVEKRLSDIPLPDEFYHESADYDVWVFRGLLSLWVQETDTVSIWVMERYKLQSSWVMTLALSLNDIPSQYFSPICSTKNGDIVGTDGYKGLVKYNGEGEVLEHRLSDEYPYASLSMYTESLLSLPDGDRIDKLKMCDNEKQEE